MKYIDADKLIAEIERRKKQDITFRERNILVDIEMCIASLRADMIITSLQQEQPQVADASKMERPEVDLEKEIEKWFDERGDAWENGEWSTNDIRSTARHFYELGLNARKED